MSAPKWTPGKEGQIPVRYESVTAGPGGCAGCGRALCSSRRRYCSDACRQQAYRRRRAVVGAPDPGARSPKRASVYLCPECEQRYLGEQYCEDCATFCRRLGIGGA